MALGAATVVSLGCGAKTDLALQERVDTRADGSVRDQGIDQRRDLGRDLSSLPDLTTDTFVPPDVWVPECPDSVRVRTREASIPVDIIFAIDSSGSMFDDIDNMRSNMHLFWEAILEADVDSRVIFVVQRGFAPSAPAAFSGRYLEVGERVGSTDGMLKLLSQFPTYSRFLRPDAITHFIGITDDDSNLPAEDFVLTMRDLLGHDFTMHAVASEYIGSNPPSNPLGSCNHSSGFAWDVGEEWYEAAEMTGGITLSICEEDWSRLFPPLTERVAVRIPIPCGYTLPTPPPPGITYRADDFTVLFEGNDGSRIVVPQDTTGSCADGGWSYFAGSQRVELCESTCSELMALDGRLDVDLGCTLSR